MTRFASPPLTLLYEFTIWRADMPNPEHKTTLRFIRWSSEKGNDHETDDNRISRRVRAVEHVCTCTKQWRFCRRKFHRRPRDSRHDDRLVDGRNHDGKRGRDAEQRADPGPLQLQESVGQHGRRKAFAERIDVNSDWSRLRPQQVRR